MEVFQFGRTGLLLDSLKGMKKEVFEKKYEKIFDIKIAWPLLQKQLGVDAVSLDILVVEEIEEDEILSPPKKTRKE